MENKKKLITILCIFTLSLGLSTSMSENLMFLEESSRTVSEKLKQDGFSGDSFIDGKVGYDSYKEKLLSSLCFNPKKVEKTPYKNELSFDKEYTREEIQELLTQKGSKSLDYQPNSNFDIEKIFPKPAAKFYKTYYYVATMKRTVNFSYDSTPSQVLTPSAKALFDQSLKKGDRKFYDYCGDGLIKSAEDGGLVIFQIIIKSESSYIYFKENKTIFLLFFLYFEHTEFQAKNIDIEIDIQAKQFGGDAEKINTVASPKEVIKCALWMDPKEKKNKAKNKIECFNFLNKIEDYVKKDFKSQFENSVSSSPHYFGFTTVKLPELSLPYTPKTDLSKIKLFREILVDFKKVNEYYLNNLIPLINQYSKQNKFELSFRTKLSQFMNSLNSNKAKLTELEFNNGFKFQHCWTDPENCTEEKFSNAFKSLENIFSDIDASIGFLETYYDYTIGFLCKKQNPFIMIFRLYPIAEKSWDIELIGGNYQDNNVDLNKIGELGDYSVISYNDFRVSALVDFIIIFKPNPLPIPAPLIDNNFIVTVAGRKDCAGFVKNFAKNKSPIFFQPRKLLF